MEYYTITTNAGDESVAHAIQTGTKTTFKQIAVGDGSGTYYEPAKTQTVLRREVWRGEATVTLDPNNAKRVIVTATIPAAVGGFTIREAGIFDTANTLMVVSKLPLSEKVAPESGASSDLVIRLYVEVSDASAVTITVDPSVVIATKMDVLKVSNDLSKHMEDVGDPHHVTAAQVGAINPNLLINCNFANPINQRGLSEYSNDSYTIDRWMALSTGTAGNTKLKVNSGYVSLSCTLANRSSVFVQRLEEYESGSGALAGKTVTASIRYRTSYSAATIYAFCISDGAFRNIAFKSLIADGNWHEVSLTYQVPVGSLTRFEPCNISVDNGIGTVDIAWAKAELCSVPTPFVPRPVAEELAMCQRYCFNPYFDSDDKTGFFTGSFISGSELCIDLSTPVSLRTTPSLIELYEKLQVFNPASGWIELPSAYSVHAYKGHVRLFYTHASFMTPGNQYLVKKLPVLDVEIY